MDELSERLAGVLNDPESMNRVRQMAESILGSGQEPSAKGDSSFFDGEGTVPSADELKKIMNIMSKLKSADDSRTRLLLALKPHLSEPRKEKVDTAIKLLKLVDLLPYIKESGILNL